MKKNVQLAKEPEPLSENKITSEVEPSLESAKSPIATSEGSKLSESERIEKLEIALAQADKNFEQIGQFLVKMQPLIGLSEQINARQQQIQTQQAQAPAESQPTTSLGGVLKGVDLGSLMSILGPVLGLGAKGSDSELAELGREALKSQISMSTAITNAVVSKITGKATSEVAEAITQP